MKESVGGFDPVNTKGMPSSKESFCVISGIGES